MFSANRHICAVEISKLSGPHIDRANAQTHVLRIVDAIEVDELLERRLQCRRIVIAYESIRGEPELQGTRGKKTWLAEEECGQRTCLSLPTRMQPGRHGGPKGALTRHAIPEA